MSSHFAQADRPAVVAIALAAADLSDEPGGIFRKRARIVGYPTVLDFTIETDRGVMTGVAGDWIVTNHPDDDPGSDLWTISAERMASTYERVTE